MRVQHRLMFVVLFCLSFVNGCDKTCKFEPRYSNNGQTVVAFYNGNVSKTVTGATCCPWNVSIPTQGVVEGTNFCRAGGIDVHAWCHVNYFGPCSDVATETWEYCDVGTYDCPLCADPPELSYPEDPLTYPCIAPQALASTDDRFISRIVGGAPAVPHEFSFYVSIQRENYGVYCAGSLIHKDWILTAAHCSYEEGTSTLTPLSAYQIKIGLHNADDDSSNACVEERTVIRRIIMPGYQPVGGDANDLAFFKLSSSSNYPPILLNYDGLTTENLERVGLMASIIGHGTTEYGGYTSYELLKSTLPIYGQELCQQSWGSSATIASSFICAGYFGGGVDTCQGDSGGPLFVKRGTTFIQIGITSFGYGCGVPDVPGVYMRVSSFHKWICSNTALPSSICQGTVAPTKGSPTSSSTGRPTLSPTTRSPTLAPTNRPSRQPTLTPTTRSPTSGRPTNLKPSKAPTKLPTSRLPTLRPTRKPTGAPTTRRPTNKPTRRPTRSPTWKPTARPTRLPTLRPTKIPTPLPTRK